MDEKKTRRERERERDRELDYATDRIMRRQRDKFQRERDAAVDDLNAVLQTDTAKYCLAIFLLLVVGVAIYVTVAG